MHLIKFHKTTNVPCRVSAPLSKIPFFPGEKTVRNLLSAPPNLPLHLQFTVCPYGCQYFHTAHPVHVGVSTKLMRAHVFCSSIKTSIADLKHSAVSPKDLAESKIARIAAQPDADADPSPSL